MQTKVAAHIKAIKIFHTKKKMQIVMLIITLVNKNILKFCRKQGIK